MSRAPWTAKNKRDTEDSGERRRSRASRAQKRKKVAYLIIACSLGILLLGSGISVVIILANSASRTAATTAPVQEPVREPVATATPAPAIAQLEPLADAQPDPAPIDKRTLARRAVQSLLTFYSQRRPRALQKPC